MIYTAKNETWTDSAGVAVPYSRVNKTERNKEKAAASLMKSAKGISAMLDEFKEAIQKASEGFYNEVVREHKADAKPRKGNYTWYNFDKSIRVEVNATERVSFRQPEIGLAQEKLEEYVSKGLGEAEDFIREIATRAFQTKAGQLDPKRVFDLLSYRTKTKAAQVHEAMDLIEKSIERTTSKTYYKIAELSANGEYEYIKLNFSEI